MYDTKDFQHPKDSKFATKILNSDTAQKFLNNVSNTNIEEAYLYLYKSSCPKLTNETSPKIFNLLKKACKEFGLQTIPEIYITRDYDDTVSVRGINNPFIVFSSEYLRKLDEQTLYGILAGQVAAIRCNHHTLFYIIWAVDFASGFIPFGSLATDPMINDWKRNRYFTYDRAFSLATKNRRLSLRQVLINVVPSDILDNMNIGTNQDIFSKQAKNFIDTMSNINSQAVIKKALSMYSYKIWLPERYEEINNFFDKGEF